jgi:hypothetical protein
MVFCGHRPIDKISCTPFYLFFVWNLIKEASWRLCDLHILVVWLIQQIGNWLRVLRANVWGWPLLRLRWGHHWHVQVGLEWVHISIIFFGLHILAWNMVITFLRFLKFVHTIAQNLTIHVSQVRKGLHRLVISHFRLMYYHFGLHFLFKNFH